jgi:hypothetical protein
MVEPMQLENTFAPVPVAERPSPELFQKRYFAPQTPVVIHGAIDSWPARHWTHETFRVRFGHVPVRIEVWDSDEATRDARDQAEKLTYQHATMAEYIDLIERHGESKRYYLAQFPIFDAIPELRRDVRPLGYYIEALRRLYTPELLWLGPAGTVTPVHFDRSQNFLVQLYGRKRVTLFAPAHTERLYAGDGVRNFSPVDVEAPDLARYPRFAQARGLQALLGPGDVLFIPRGWWHHVRSLDPAISLNLWWLSVPEAMRTLPTVLARRLIRPLFPRPAA